MTELGQLHEEVARLRDENEVLRGLIGTEWFPPQKFRLSRIESKLLGYLMKSKIARKEQILVALYDGREEYLDRDVNIASVYICKLRKKLKPFNINIETYWGVGFYIDNFGKQLILNMGDA